MYYEQLKAGVIQHDLLVDNLIYKVLFSTPTGATFIATIFMPSNVNLDLLILKFSWIVLWYDTAKPEHSLYIQLRFFLQDVKLTASNDDYYFVFEDFLYQVLMRKTHFPVFTMRQTKQCLSLMPDTK